MFVLTMKFNKRLAIIIIATVAVLLAALVFAFGFLGNRQEQPVRLGAGSSVKTEEDRIAYLRGLGWECDAESAEEQTIVLPREFTGAIGEYNDLQKQQGFDLSEYSGLEATAYRYKVLNYPAGNETVIAQIIVLNYKIIGGDIHSSAVNGFMHGLK